MSTAANDEALQALMIVLEHWAKFGLDARRSTLDSQAARIAEAQDAALKSRRELTEQTKVRVCAARRVELTFFAQALKKLTGDERAALTQTLLKVSRFVFSFSFVVDRCFNVWPVGTGLSKRNRCPHATQQARRRRVSGSVPVTGNVIMEDELFATLHSLASLQSA